ncbi:hypothetical protein L917_21580, partial [Phytophthora nicotianae]
MDKTFEVYSAVNSPDVTANLIHESDRLQLNTYQAFVRSAMSPRSDFRSLLLVHMTGTGKTVTALATATEYIRQYQPRAENSAVSSVIVLGYTKDIFKKELVNHPEFMFVSREEAKELREMEAQSGRSRAVKERFELLRKRYQRRIINREHIGAYQFYGFRQFANMVFNNEDLAALMKEQQKSNMEDVDSMLLHAWIRDGKVRVNTSFIAGLRRSLFICDEVHNLYRNGSLNTYGMAICLVFEHFFETLPANHADHGAVRSLLLSATPLTASALEIVPIAQLLTGEKLAATELFESVLGVEQLTPEGAAKVRQVVSGKISYVMDDNPASGSHASCGASRPHWADRGGSDEEYGNNMAKDIAFPGVPIRPHGVLYSQHLAALRELPEPLRLTIDSSSSSRGLYESQMLALPMLRQYSCKNATLVELCTALEGKVIVYHPQVQGSGVNLISSLLVANGFVLHGEHPNRKSKCAKCHAAKGGEKAHASDHDFVPMPDNDGGKHLKIVLGSKAMSEGHSLMACRHVIVAHEPGSISEMVQIIGRAVRKQSHERLPAAQRTVTVHVVTTSVQTAERHLPDAVLQSTSANEELSYKLKMMQYEQIRRVEQIMHDSAVDYLVNFRFKQRETPPLLGEEFPLDLPRFERYERALTAVYSDLRNGVAPVGIHSNRFNVFYFESEVRLVMMIIKRIVLDFQPVISIAQLDELVREPPFYVEYNTRLISSDAIAVAVHKLAYKRSQQRLKMPDRSTPLADVMFDQSPVLVDAAGVEYRIVYVGPPLGRDAFLAKRTLISVLRGDDAMVDAFRHVLPSAPSTTIDLHALAAGWESTLDIAEVVAEFSDRWKQGDVVGAVNKLPMKTQAKLVEWAIESAVSKEKEKVDDGNGDLVRLLLGDYYSGKRLVFSVADLTHTRLAKQYARFNKGRTAKMPIGHSIGLFHVYQPADGRWLELRTVGQDDDQAAIEHPYGFFIYEERKGLSVVTKIRVEDDPKAKGIQMAFLPKTSLERVAKKLDVAIQPSENKADIVRRLEQAAWVVQKKLYYHFESNLQFSGRLSKSNTNQQTDLIGQNIFITASRAELAGGGGKLPLPLAQ